MSDLNPAQLETNDFGLQQTNFITGMPGLYVGLLSPARLLALTVKAIELARYRKRTRRAAFRSPASLGYLPFPLGRHRFPVTVAGDDG